MFCQQCGSTKFRASRLRVTDLTKLLCLRLPIRCRSCSLRRYTNILEALRIRRADKIRHGEQHHHTA
jgi:hypothetical protein